MSSGGFSREDQVKLDSAALYSEAFCNIWEQMSPGVRVQVPGGEPIEAPD